MDNLKFNLMDNHIKSVLIAFFVTILWSSSWIFIVFGLKSLPPLLFASFRYSLASVILMVMMLSKIEYRREIKGLSPRDWLQLMIYGLLFISITQGIQFISLKLFPAITLSFVLNFTTVIVVILAIPILHEFPSFIQLLLIIISIGGGLLYFYPYKFLTIRASEIWLLPLIVLINGLSLITGRSINKRDILSPLPLTSISMSFGAVFLLGYAMIVESISAISMMEIAIITWLAVINTALAFTLWNHAMKTLKAFEITIINNTMLPQITILALIFLGESPTIFEWIGIIIIIVTSILIQMDRNHESQK